MVPEMDASNRDALTGAVLPVHDVHRHHIHSKHRTQLLHFFELMDGIFRKIIPSVYFPRPQDD